MARIASILVFSFVIGCAGAPPKVSSKPEAPTRREVVRGLLGHNLRLHIYDGATLKKTASGVVVAREETPHGVGSYIVTNAHALETHGYADPRLRVVVERDGEDQELNAEVVAVGRVPEMDLALIRVRGVGLPPARFAAVGEMEAGDSVVVAAAPFGRAISLSGGLLSHVDRDRRTGEPLMIKTDAAIGYGASGGGVYSLSTGNLLAIVEGYRTAKVGFAVAEQAYSFDVPLPGETFAAPVTKVRRFLESQGYGRLVQPQDARASSNF